jgi:LPXTG-motif cell wall-anchored protein
LIDLATALLDVLQIAHETDFFHEEPMKPDSGGGASTIIILAGVLATLAAVGGLIWLKKRVDG